MKKAFLSLFLVSGTLLSYSQPTTGLIAHWDMNGTTNDVTGAGHNGHGNNLTAAAGIDGVAGHAWYFNGTSSSITIPYMSDLNVSQFTIATTMMVKGFYTDPCHGNTLFIRGKTSVYNGSFLLQFTDYPAGYGCTPAIDTNQESFVVTATSSSSMLAPPPPFTAYNDTPHVQLNQWYTVVVTFNDTVYNIYINDTLRRTIASPSPGVPMGTSTDSAAIGFAPYDNAIGYPYYFKGIMDDMKFYNRALSSCEVSKLMYWTNTLITRDPVNDTAAPGSTVTYSISDTGIAGTYQWQVNAGSGFANIAAAAPYSGVTTKILTVNPVTAAMNTYKYRCIRNSGSGCVDTSGLATFVINTSGVNSFAIPEVSIIPNPAKDIISVACSVDIDNIEIINLLGQKVVAQKPAKSAVILNIHDLATGIYIVKINNIYAGRFVKE